MCNQSLTPLQLLRHPVHFLSLGLGTGLCPKIPGTAGTLIGVLVFLPLYSLGWTAYLCVLVVLFLVGIPMCAYTAKALGTHDHPAIVWDEIVGYLATMVFVPPQWYWMVIGFLLFRLFDITKPYPISWLDKRVKGGFGIMLDDLIAALSAWIFIKIMLSLI